MVEYLIEGGYIQLEEYFVDGTKIEADANKHKVVWAKKKEKYEKRVKEQIAELLKRIEAENEAEQAEYGDKDLEERGGNSLEDLNGEKLKEKVAEINRRVRERLEKKKDSHAARQALKKLESDCLPRLEKYKEQEQKLAGRNSYSQTDPDASSMRMKEDRGAEKAWPKPAYNIQVGTEGQFIVGYSVHGQAGDTTCLIPHLEGVLGRNKRFPQKIVADAAYGSEENYAYLEQHGLGNYLKYNTFYQDTHSYRKAEIIRQHQFRAENFIHDPQTDQFICPAQKRLHFRHTTHPTTTHGFETERRIYECQDCQDCPLRSQCTQAKENRKISISFRLLAYRRQARENLTSEEGKRLRTARSTEVETVFGHLKHNMGFRRFHLRGFQKVKTEWGILSIAHNMQKMAVI